VYIPEGVLPNGDAINQIGSMNPGEGYQVFTTSSVELLYPPNGDIDGQTESQDEMVAQSTGFDNVKQSHFQKPSVTGNNAILVLESDALNTGDEIAVYGQNGTLSGSTIVHTPGSAIVTVWGNDPVSKHRGAGPRSGEELTLRLWSMEDNREKEIVVHSVINILNDSHSGNRLVYKQNGFYLAEIEVIEDIPDSYVLHQNYPNPFNPVTTIMYGIPENTYVLLEVYNILGQRIKTLVDEEKDAGMHEVQFDGSRHSSGTYFYRIQAGDYTATKKFILLK